MSPTLVPFLEQFRFAVKNFLKKRRSLASYHKQKENSMLFAINKTECLTHILTNWIRIHHVSHLTSLILLFAKTIPYKSPGTNLSLNTKNYSRFRISIFFLLTVVFVYDLTVSEVIFSSDFSLTI